MFRLFFMFIYIGIGLSFSSPDAPTIEKAVTAIVWPLYIGKDIGYYLQH